MAVANIHGTGRRKKAVARVFLKSGSGKILVNGKEYNDYFTTDTMKIAVTKPLVALDKKQSYDIQVNVHGGGLAGQADAVGLGISRALLREDEAVRKTLRSNDLLTVDSRVKERKKYGQKAARRKFQFVKR